MIFTSSTRFLFLGTLLTTLCSLQASAAPAPALVTVAAPFFNPISATDALPATILGVDAAGRTTYALNQDEVQDNISYKTTLAKITGTLVAAADYASYTIAADVPGLAITLGFDCSVDGKSGNAVCTGLDESSHAATATASLQTFAIDVLATATPSGGAKPSSAGRLVVPVVGTLMGVVLGWQLV